MNVIDQPSGQVTLVFSDIEGSTKLLHALGAEAYREALAEHRSIVRAAYARYSGYEVDYEGDAFFYAFSSASDALSAVSEAMAGLEEGPIRIRVGIHTGSPVLDPPKYVGMDVHFAARVMSCAHGGQVVCSAATRDALDPSKALVQALSSLGSHRLKDIHELVSLFQLGDGAFPPLKTIANSNLPTPASSFLGREEELHDADAALQATRLLTIHGPGGQGKTRFALELATRAREERFSDYQDGVFACFLASLRDPSLVLPTIAQTLSVSEQPGNSALAALSAHLQAKKLLLLLDNLEHVLACARELAELVSACTGLTLLVTSRELARVQGEVAYELPPLAETDGVTLFCERAQVAPSDTIRAICTRLEGLPLAIELAAARLRLLSPEQLLERLAQRLDLLKGARDADPRQQTLRATIQWSFDLLTPDEQTLFARLSVFAGGCTLEAAEEVCEADLDTLESLLDKSLVRRIDGRIWMLETIREFAGERLEGGEAGAVRARHLAWVLTRARTLAPRLYRTADPIAMKWLMVEMDNIRDAYAMVIRERLADEAFELVGLLTRTMVEHGRFSELESFAGLALELESENDAARAEALIAMGYGALSRGDSPIAHWETAFELYTRTGRTRGAAIAQGLLANAMADDGRLAEATALYELSLALFEELGDDEGERVVRMNLADSVALLARTDDERRAALRLVREVVAETTLHGDPFDQLACRCALAELLLDIGDIDDARFELVTVTELARTSAALRTVPGIAELFAKYSLARGEIESAAIFWAAGETHSGNFGRQDFQGRRSVPQLDPRTEAVFRARGEAMTLEALFELFATTLEAEPGGVDAKASGR